MLPNDKLNERLVQSYERWMIAQQYASHTQYVRSRMLRMYTNSLKGKLITRATHHEIRSFVSEISESGLSLNVVNQHLCCLRMFYDFLNLGGMVGYSPPRLVRVRMVPRGLPHVLSEAEVLKLIDACRSKRERAYMEVGYGTGCRPFEMRHLKVEDVDFESRTLRVSAKGRTRVIPFGRRAYRALVAYLAGRKSGFVFQWDFPHQKLSLYENRGRWKSTMRDYSGPKSVQLNLSLGKVRETSYRKAMVRLKMMLRGVQLRRPDRVTPLSQNGLLRMIDAVGRRAGLRQKVRPKQLRHCYATHLLDHGADVRVIQQLLGHAKIESTATYTRVSMPTMEKTFYRCHPRES
jgi:site-specific recombinase XerD